MTNLSLDDYKNILDVRDKMKEAKLDRLIEERTEGLREDILSGHFTNDEDIYFLERKRGVLEGIGLLNSFFDEAEQALEIAKNPDLEL